jgi:3-phosphoshikimate 1-carboxyvinyltransferase
MPLPAILPLQPFTHPARGEVIVPGSKSLTNRALLLAALCEKPVTLTGALFSEDTQLMGEALRRLGFTVTADEAAHTVTVSGQENAFRAEQTEIFVGLAGTAARFLTALCAAAARGIYRLDGVAQMRKRPMKPLIDALRRLGADIRCTGEEGFFPLEIRASGLSGGTVELDAQESSQLLSALLMVAPLARDDVTVLLLTQVREPFVEMTLNLMDQFGVNVGRVIDQESAAGYRVTPSRYELAGKIDNSTYAIEPDATAASYFLALPIAVRGLVTLRHITANSLQGDVKFADVLKRVGLNVSTEGAGFVVSHSGGPLRGVAQDFNAFSDTFLTLAALAPLLMGPTRISGIAHTRKQETDRVAGIARELKKLGQQVDEQDDALTITPRPLVAGQTIETYGDHRFAMSFGILGCHDLHRNGKSWLTIRDPACCAKTFPHFFELLDTVRKKSSGA